MCVYDRAPLGQETKLPKHYYSQRNKELLNDCGFGVKIKISIGNGLNSIDIHALDFCM